RDEDIRNAVNLALRRIPDGDEERGNRGAGVTVAIIDTWPVGTHGPDEDNYLFAAGEEAVARLDPNSPARQRLRRVLDTVKTGGVIDLLKQSEVHELCIHRHGCDGPIEELCRNYEDHGLFIAGIVQEIAPNATIRVYRALNKTGCTKYELIAKAVARAVA